MNSASAGAEPSCRGIPHPLPMTFSGDVGQERGCCAQHCPPDSRDGARTGSGTMLGWDTTAAGTRTRGWHRLGCATSGRDPSPCHLPSASSLLGLLACRWGATLQSLKCKGKVFELRAQPAPPVKRLSCLVPACPKPCHLQHCPRACCPPGGRVCAPPNCTEQEMRWCTSCTGA